MPTVRTDHLASELRSDLGKLADILQNEAVCADTNPLQQTIGSLRFYEDASGVVRSKYQLTRLVMRLGNLRRCFPPLVGNVSCTLSVRAESSIPVDPAPPHDPFDKLEINFILEGYIPSQTGRYMQSWHFDRHIHNEGDNTPEDTHPMYHFQFGGRMMQDHAARSQMPPETTFGRTVLLDGPRLAHPPMDLILAVDFVLSHFLGQFRKRLARSNREYLKMVSRSQARIWKPYSDVLGYLWSRQQVADTRWTASSLWPQFLPIVSNLVSSARPPNSL